jgi:hypothetical protein
MRLTERTLAAAARVDRVLAVPVLSFTDLPLVSFAIGQPTGWQWPPVGTQRHGFVYFARVGDGATKIGFSCEPVERVLVCNVMPVLFVGVVQMRHERALHSLFQPERIECEIFRGDRVESFVALALKRTVAHLRDYRLTGYRIQRASTVRRIAQKESAA